MVASIALRSALLLTLDNSEPRYTLEFFPVLIVLAWAAYALILPGLSIARQEPSAVEVQVATWLLRQSVPRAAKDAINPLGIHPNPAAVTAWAPIDILVLNASIELPEDFQAITREHFDRQIAINLRTTMELLQTLMPPMAERGFARAGRRSQDSDRSSLRTVRCWRGYSRAAHASGIPRRENC